jgi:serine protease Do
MQAGFVSRPGLDYGRATMPFRPPVPKNLGSMMFQRALLFLALVLSPIAASAEPSVPTTADAIYADARPKLMQIQTLLGTDGQKHSTGSSFLVSADGLAITNYHVVSEYALEPDTYRLEYVAIDGKRGPVRIVAIDLADDLALIRIDRTDQPFFQFDDRAVAGTLPKGERLYAMGDPLDLGSSIVDGTYNGLVDRSYADRYHFTGAINSGMSGGPAVSGAGRVAGINVAKQLNGELVGFLVPARFAAALLAENGAGAPPAVKDLKSEIGRQLTVRQSGFYRAIEEAGFRPAVTGPYRTQESAAPWFTCWAQTNTDQIPRPRTIADLTSCFSDSRLFIADGLNPGLIQLSHEWLRTSELNPFQFSFQLSQQARGGMAAKWPQKWLTRQSCRDDFVAGTEERPVQHVVWCARAYRDFDDLYDVSVTLTTEDRDHEALVSRLVLDGVSFGNAMILSQHFVEGVQWNS